MGLAPYGKPRFVDQFRRLVDMRSDGSFRLNMEYFSHHWSNKYPFREQKWQSLFGMNRRQPDEELQQEHSDLARSGQAVVEELILGIARYARQRYHSENLVIAGGVGLNSVANWKLNGHFQQLWISRRPAMVVRSERPCTPVTPCSATRAYPARLHGPSTPTRRSRVPGAAGNPFAAGPRR
jgi:predicted NodU family carbamoyl transferase